MWKLFSHGPTSILDASSGERQEAIARLVEATTLRKGYYLLLTLSIVIVTLGLLAENAPIIIGGMVVAPLLTPILLLAMSIVSRSMRGVRHAVTVLFASIAIALLLAPALTWIVAHITPLPVFVPARIHAAVYLLVALCSGIVASLAWVKKEWSATISGIAISVSLLPPLCSAGIGFGLQRADVLHTGLTVFSMNVLGILGAATVTFILLGFSQLGHVTERSVRNEERVMEKQAKQE